MKPATLLMLKENLKNLKLANMFRHLESQIRQAREEGLAYGDFLLELTEIELRIRAENRDRRRIREARFPLLKPLETFDFSEVPDLSKRQIKELASSCDYIKERRNIIFMGRSGAGKTHLATALGLEACQQNFKTRFVSGYALANELIESYDDRSLSRIISRYKRLDLLVLDELGYVPFSKEGAELLFQILAERHEQGSVIITTNLGFADWTKIFGEASMTAALLDRLTHNAYIIECNWDSYRLKQSLKNRRQN